VGWARTLKPRHDGVTELIAGHTRGAERQRSAISQCVDEQVLLVTVVIGGADHLQAVELGQHRGT
jgi:hypothetical protein